MSHLSENTDELFRKAAEEYPLRTGKPDWESFSQKMANDLYRKKGLKYFLQKSAQLVVVTALLFVPFKIKDLLVKNNFSSKQLNKTASITATVVKSNSYLAAVKNDYNNYNSFTIVSTKNILNEAETATKNASAVLVQANFPVINNYQNALQNILAEHNNADATKAEILKQEEVKAQEQDNANTAKKDLIKLRIPSKKKFYLGATIAPEFASVKHQSISKPGYSAGFLVGYKINDKLQVEAGMVLSHKYYYTGGKYTEPNTLRRDEKPINNVDAFTSVTEFPVNVQYNVRTTNNSRIFASVGTVSSLVHKDRYDYDFTKNNGEEREVLRKFNKSSDNLISNIQFSAGYEQQLGKIVNVRVEPYYRLPLNGIGKGNLPVTSIGINVGITGFIK